MQRNAKNQWSWTKPLRLCEPSAWEWMLMAWSSFMFAFLGTVYYISSDDNDYTPFPYAEAWELMSGKKSWWWWGWCACLCAMIFYRWIWGCLFLWKLIHSFIHWFIYSFIRHLLGTNHVLGNTVFYIVNTDWQSWN